MTPESHHESGAAQPPPADPNSAREVAGRSIGQWGLAYITAIVLIGVGSAYWLDQVKLPAVMAVIGGALTALIQMLNGIAGTIETRPGFRIIQSLIERMDRLDARIEPFSVAVEEGRVQVQRAADTIMSAGKVGLPKPIDRGT